SAPLALHSFPTRRSSDLPRARRRPGRSAPHLARRLDDELELRLLLVGGDRVALHRRGEAALPAETELLQRDVPGGLLDPPLEVVLFFQRSALGGHEAEDDDLSLLHEAQR